MEGAMKWCNNLPIKSQIMENHVENVMEIWHSCLFHAFIFSLVHTYHMYLSVPIFCFQLESLFLFIDTPTQLSLKTFLRYFYIYSIKKWMDTNFENRYQNDKLLIIWSFKIYIHIYVYINIHCTHQCLCVCVCM